MRQAQSQVVSAITVRDNNVILDIGCGTGYALGLLASKVKGDGQFYGVDLSEKMVEKAKENLKNAANFHFVMANAESIPLQDDFFDIIICTNSFHHYLHPETALREMHRLLKPGGMLYILDPTTDSWVAKPNDRIFRLIEAQHVKMYSTEEYQQMYEMAGLRYVNEKTLIDIHIGEK